MPVPSIMMGFMLTVVGTLNSLVSWQTNFIMMSGPMVMTRSYCSPPSMSSLSASVTRPFSPQEPSSLILHNFWLAAANSSSRITKSLFLKPTMECTSQPCSWSFLAMG